MDTQYEEKTFESYFNNELNRSTSIYFPLGQVQEGILGADSVAHSGSQRLWKRLGHPFLLSPREQGVELEEIAKEMESFLGKEVNNIPAMKVNLLFQYKRPQYITRASGAEWHLWNREYFRYDLYQKQHVLLSRIESKFGSDATVLYAAPAVKDINELVRLKKNNAVIDNTNFRRAVELNGHHRNTYTKSGAYSQACSEPQRLENIKLLELIKSSEASKQRENSLFVEEFAEGIDKLMRQSQEIDYLGTAFVTRMSEYQEFDREQFRLFFAFLTMNVFREVTGVQWVVPLNANITE